MKGLKKLVLVSAIAAAPFAQAELKAIDDAAMADISGQSGLLVEVGMGNLDTTDVYNLDWENSAGVTIEAFKWEVDLEQYDKNTNVHSADKALSSDGVTPMIGGVIAKGISIAGNLDMTIDGVFDGMGDSYDADSGYVDQLGGGIAIGFEKSNISLRVDEMRVYAIDSEIGAVETESMGAIEVIGLNLSNVDITLSGR